MNTQENLSIEQLRKFYQSTQQKLEENLVCRICLELVINPVECATCEWEFCSACLDKWLEKNNQCINRCPPPMKKKDPHRSVKSKLQDISVYCGFRQNGCQEIISYDNVQKHRQVCKYSTLFCVDDCGWTGSKAQLDTHKKSCPYIQDKDCPNCKETMKVIKFQNHNCFLDLKKQLNTLSEKFIDFKESSNFNITQLKLQVQEQQQKIAELQSKTQELQEKLKNQEGNSPLKQQQQQQQQSPQKQTKPHFGIKNGQLGVFSQKTKCPNGHYVNFWCNPNGEEKTKNCGSCNKTNVSCRYICQTCQQYYCLGCIMPEIKIDSCRQAATNCPAFHGIEAKTGTGTCEVCQQTSIKKFFICTDCKFVECLDCVQKGYCQSRRTGFNNFDIERNQCPQQ